MPARSPPPPDVAALAELARIQLAPDEGRALASDLARITEYLGAIRQGSGAPRGAATEEETKGVEAAEALAAPLRDHPALARLAGDIDGLREDAVSGSPEAPRVVRLFPKTDGARVKVPKGLE